MADLTARMSVEVDGLLIEVNVEGGRDLAAMDLERAAVRAAERCARAMLAALVPEVPAGVLQFDGSITAERAEEIRRTFDRHTGLETGR